LPPLPSTPTTQALPPSTFTASPEEMSKATSQCSPTAVNDIDKLHESLQCFIDAFSGQVQSTDIWIKA
jgi:hypothetical protein